MSKSLTSAGKTKITLLSRLESKNGQKWIDLYRDDTYREPSFYYSTYKGGRNMGNCTLQEAATEVCEVAASMGRLYRVPL